MSTPTPPAPPTVPSVPTTVPIVVIGMMAAGKTTLGRALAEAIGAPYHDSDEMIELTRGGNGRALAEDRGVDWLHALEADVLTQQLDQGGPSVISAAASVVDAAACRRQLQARAFVCWVDVPVEVLEARINRDDHRRPMSRSELQDRYAKRLPRFREITDVRVDGMAPLPAQVSSVIEAFGRIEP